MCQHSTVHPCKLSSQHMHTHIVSNLFLSGSDREGCVVCRASRRWRWQISFAPVALGNLPLPLATSCDERQKAQSCLCGPVIIHNPTPHLARQAVWGRSTTVLVWGGEGWGQPQMLPVSLYQRNLESAEDTLKKQVQDTSLHSHVKTQLPRGWPHPALRLWLPCCCNHTGGPCS